MGISGRERQPVKVDYCGVCSPSDTSGSDEEQSPRWSLAPHNWQPRRQCAAAADQDTTSQLWQWLIGLVLGALVMAVVGTGIVQLTRSRQLHLEMWREAVRAAHGRSAAAQPSCALQLRGSPWERHCQRLDRVCFDQGTIILYDSQYQQLDGRKAGRLPELLVDTSKIYEYPWRETSSERGGDGGDGGSGERRRLLYDVQTPGRNRRIPPVPLRPATSQEPTPYLAAPSFSSCTVPILLYSSWRGNFFHIFKDMGAQVYALLRRTPWRGHAKLVMVTPEGLPLTQPEAQLLPPLSRLSVQSLADFSARLPPGWPAAAPLDPAAPPPSFEGGEQRCFQTAFFCGRNFPMETGLPPEEEAALSEAERQERLAAAVPQEPYSFGQAVSAFLQQRRSEQGRTVEQLAQDAISLQDTAVKGGGARQRAATSGRLRVGLMRRGGEGRQLLNSEELLQSCNAWSYTPPRSSTPVTAECHEISVPDLAAGAAAAAEADVFVGIHGANLANGWMLRPGASVIEVTPFQFEYGRGSFVFSATNARDATSQVLWWVAVLCDPAASTPGPLEAAGEGLQEWWPRDRNLRLPWAAVEEILREVVAAGGSQQRYLQDYYETGLHRFNFDAAGVVGRGGRCPNATAPPP